MFSAGNVPGTCPLRDLPPAPASGHTRDAAGRGKAWAGPRAGAALPRRASLYIVTPRRHPELPQLPEAIPLVLADGRSPTRHSDPRGGAGGGLRVQLAGRGRPPRPTAGHRVYTRLRSMRYVSHESFLSLFFWNRAVIITFNQNESHTKKGGNIDNDTTDPSGTDRHGQTDSPQSCARSPGQDVAACLTP